MFHRRTDWGDVLLLKYILEWRCAMLKKFVVNLFSLRYKPSEEFMKLAAYAVVGFAMVLVFLVLMISIVKLL